MDLAQANALDYWVNSDLEASNHVDSDSTDCSYTEMNFPMEPDNAQEAAEDHNYEEILNQINSVTDWKEKKSPSSKIS